MSVIIDKFNDGTATSFLNDKQVNSLMDFINEYFEKIRSFRDYSVKATIAPNSTEMLTNLFYLSDGKRKKPLVVAFSIWQWHQLIFCAKSWDYIIQS